MLAAAYCRVSTDSNDQANSLENQTSYFNREISKHGYTLHKVYADQGLSGTKLSRPQFDELLHDAGIDIFYRNGNKRKPYFELSRRKPLFSKIFVKNTSRFARNILSYELISLLRQNNITIRFCEQNLDTGDVAQDFLIKLMQIFDEQDSKDKSSKVRWGNEESSKRNRVRSTGKLYGYSYSKTLEQGGKLEVVPKEAEVIRLIYASYMEGMGIRTIAKMLTEKGYRTRNGKPFGRTTIRHILDNEKYAGLNNPLKYDCGQVLLNEHHPRVRNKYMIAESNNIDAIISPQQFEKVQQLIKSRSKGTQGIYLGNTKYAHLIVCGKCGCAYHSNCDNGRRFYNCFGKKSGNGCKNSNISEQKLDASLEKIVPVFPAMIQAQHAYALKYVVSKIKELLDLLDVDKLKAMQEIDEQIDKLKEEQKGYAELFATVASTRDVMKKKIVEMDERIVELENKRKGYATGNEEIKIELKKYLRSIETLKESVAEEREVTADNILKYVNTIFIGKEGCDFISYELKLNNTIDETLGHGWYSGGVMKPSEVEQDIKDIDMSIVKRAIEIVGA